MKRILPLLLALAALAGCAEQTRNPPRFIGPKGSMQSGIVGGTLDPNPNHDAVVYIEIGGLGGCTGTLISANVILTAAHCVSDEDGTFIGTPGTYKVYFDTNIDGYPETQAVVNLVVRHPQYNPDWGAYGAPANDIALLRINSKPSSVTPIPYLPHTLSSSLAVGGALEHSGYGLQLRPGVECSAQGYNCDGDGKKYHATNTIGKVCALSSTSGCSYSSYGPVPPGTICYLQATPTGGPCMGDSGGPAFITVNGTEYVVGATSYGDGSCNSFGCSTKVDEFESFLAPYIGAQKPNGQACTGVIDCASGNCVDGVCCNTVCNGPCEACSIAAGTAVNGTCGATPGASCSDGNECTTVDTCSTTAGVCTGGTSVNCASTNPCRVNQTCNPVSGACGGGSNAPDGTACNDNNAATTNDKCTAGVCAGTVANPCAGKPDNTPCDDGNKCNSGDVCKSGVCTAGTTVNTCPAPDLCRMAGTCNPSTGTCTFPNQPNGTACSDGNPCTSGDYCYYGGCLAGSTPVTCPAPDACHTAGTCNPTSGCPTTYPTRPNGTTCNDNNACTSNDVCTAGVCKGTATATTCPADQCHEAGTCNPATGACSGTNKPDGTACNDGDGTTLNDVCTTGICKGTFSPCAGIPNGSACDDFKKCTTDDACQSGACVGTAKTCTPNACQTGGTCSTSDGSCVFGNAPNGTSCNDGNAATTNDVCTAGVCAGTLVVNPCTGKPEGSACDDGNPGTDGDKCTAGTCAGTPNPCYGKADGTACDDGNAATANDQCTAGVCAGTVIANPCAGKPDGSACNDNNPATDADRCTAGACTGTLNPCYGKADGTACNDGNPGTDGDQCTAGACSGKPNPCYGKADGTACDDGNPNSVNDHCSAGTCVGAAATACTGKPDGAACNDNDPATDPDACKAGVCVGTPKTGACAGKPEGASCDDLDPTTGGDVCTGGICKGTPVTGPCGGKPDTTACDDGKACTRDDFCEGGVCVGHNPKPCATPGPCEQDDGACQEQTGECAYSPKADATACDDEDAQTTGDRCVAGVCKGTPIAPSECEGKADGTACSKGTCKSGTCTVEIPQEDGGCGCGASGTSPATALFAAVGLLGLIRRRRSA